MLRLGLALQGPLLCLLLVLLLLLRMPSFEDPPCQQASHLSASRREKTRQEIQPKKSCIPQTRSLKFQNLNPMPETLYFKPYSLYAQPYTVYLFSLLCEERLTLQAKEAAERVTQSQRRQAGLGIRVSGFWLRV